jgi:3'(2'), 5'-bisphosphate nucleotidase
VTAPQEGSDGDLAALLAEEAGQLLLSMRATVGRLAINPYQLGQHADQRANTLILDRLARARPGDAVLSEEAADDPIRLSSSRVWIIDPLDGTREYMMGRDDWAVHVALWESGSGVTAAAVALPAFGRVFATNALDADGPPPRPSSGRPLLLVSPTRPPWFAPALAQEVGGELATMGSAGAKAMAVLCGDAVAYVHAAGQREWDSAAPVGVIRAAGYHASRIDGSELIYNQPNPYIPDFLICRADLTETLLGAIARARGARR